MKKVETYIDHTLLKANATESDIRQLCQEALQYNFFAVCVNGHFVSLCKQLLANSKVQIASVVGFPLGANTTKSKIHEATIAIQDGATEIDMVINMDFLKSRNEEKFVNEIASIKKSIGNHLLKVIIETCYLSEEEKKLACQWSVAGNCDYVKTSTGFGNAGATIADVKLMSQTVNTKAKIKASGGIKTLAQLNAYIDIGASRIGTSNGVSIIQELS